jgi:hypothetical protein
VFTCGWWDRGTLREVRWERLFDDLEGQFAQADREEFGAEIADRGRREMALIPLLDRVRSAVGTRVELSLAGAGWLGGVVRCVGQDWLLLDIESQPQALVLGDAILAARALPSVAALATTTVGAADPRLGLGHALRAIARDRSAVVVVVRDGSEHTGTIDRVGADFVDLAEHAPGEPRRAGQVSGVRTITFAGMAVVRPR